jgi:predicted  nucleic acid-binding Zn-ribbon protein
LDNLERESEKLSAELATISDELKKRQEQVKSLESLLQVSEIRFASLERSMNQEREAAQIAISSALEREARAIKERDFWMVGGITLAVIGVSALAISFLF